MRVASLKTLGTCDVCVPLCDHTSNDTTISGARRTYLDRLNPVSIFSNLR